MKKLIYIVIIFLLASCGSNKEQTQKEKTSISTMKIGELEVMTKDLGTMTWDKAKKACADLGDGWRLPTKNELNILFKNKEEIGGFSPNFYWNSTEGDGDFAYTQDFAEGGYQGPDNKDNLSSVRAVRAI
jgi:hypothetical protein